ncbi:short-chain fatty acid transporter [Haloterrigena salifodinae]|uniref:Short-chain fatty acid transporter n=1 Tax=Haloterrigena salifodinae TaxID=2675099 RepID=A0A8T8E240_9EURY|nr:TIGR00366 family protein [Haloterrigena salifodinae]QRV15829.1 short-chain fatty acid transporter [Haloterrigena salifodinae]
MSAPVESEPRGTVIERAGEVIADVVERWMPSPFLFAIILSYVVFVVGMVVEGQGPTEMVGFWYDGFWAFLTFAMQMVLIIMTGFVIAYHPRVNDALQWLATFPDNGRQAVVLVGVVSMALAWIHWGLSLVVGAIFAREMGKAAYRRDIDVHYPLLCVAGYMGLGLTWHWGLSGSAPLLLATSGNEFIELGVVDDTVGTSATIFSTYALALTGLSIVFAAIVLYLLSPSPERSRDISAYVSEDELLEAKPETEPTTDESDDLAVDGGSPATDSTGGTDARLPAEKIDNSRLLGGVIALTGVAVVAWQFYSQGLDALDLNVLNFAFLFAGLAIYTRPMAYRDRFGEASEAAAGIILLFPFFAGIQGMMAGSGLAETIATGLLAVSTPETFPIIAWITGAIVNFFVPSGGGEWIVLGPSVLEAAHELGIETGHATMAYAVGDAHTNLANPFWALPLLAITDIRAREMFGYAVAMLLALIPFLTVALYVLPY